jgi:hypothetical protein
MEAERPYDALIIGAGIGGLSAGIILSLLRLRVAVIEKNPLPGGLMRSYRREGLDCPVGIHYFGSFGEGEPVRMICDYLGVTGGIAAERMGRGGPVDRYLFDDLRSICRKASTLLPLRWNRPFRMSGNPSRRSSETSVPPPTRRIPSPSSLLRLPFST